MSITKENFMPPSNLPPQKGCLGKIFFGLRVFADLPIASVLFYLKPWLKSQKGKILEVGCGAQPYRHMLNADCVYTGLDWVGAQSNFKYKVPDTIYYDGKKFPYGDNSFDAVLHTEVLEHIWDYKEFLSECLRVLKKDGKMFFAIPFSVRYHYIPHDFWRFTPAALERILKEAGFREIIIKSRGSDITVLMYKFISLVYRWLFSRTLMIVLGAILLPFVLLPLIIAHCSIGFNVGSCDDCIGYVVNARK